MKYFLLLILLIKLQTGFAMNVFDFKNDILPNKPNHFLICPANYCKATANLISPNLPFPVHQLALNFEQMINQQPRVTLISKEPKIYLYFYMQRSKLFKFPDFITVQLISIDEHNSTIAMYSQAKYGYYDFDVNKKRLITWLQALEK